jgi:eukaryotic-like serine/threonine-protein kinase
VVAPRQALMNAFRDRYRIERELGRGGMATVYLAQDLRHERHVALKVLHPELAATVGPERFQREIKLAARLQHPHILSVFDSGETAGQLWYTMPYVQGESLRDRLRRERQLPLDDALQITREVADALGYAHRQGIVHRDIKPENILLSEGHALVADFGVARALQAAGGEGLTETGTSVGTPAYMSPEQAMADSALDGRSDLYSLGCVLYEMLTGEAPYTGPSAQAIVAKRLIDPVPSARRLRETVPPGLDGALQRVLAKAAADRFPTADAFARALSHTFAAIQSNKPQPRRAAFSTGRRIAVVVLLVGTALILGLVARARLGAKTVPAGGPKMVAVLPLKNLGAPGDEYFADGLTEEITSRLTSISNLGVISRTSADQYRNTTKPLKQIGRELGVNYILEGSVRWEKSPDGRSRVRVTPQLIGVADDRHLWADRYDAELADVFQVQGDIAGKVASALGVAIGPSERRALAAGPTANLDAYAFYLRGRQLARSAPSPSEEGVKLFEQAVALDSTFALAYVALARENAQVYTWHIERTESRRARAEAALAAALRLRPDLADAWQAQGEYYTDALFDYGRALRSLTVADSLRPNDGGTLADIARVELNQGLVRKALEHYRRAVSLSPRDDANQLELGRLLAWMRDYAEADRHLSAAVALVPEDPYLRRWKAYAARLSGDTTAERRVLREAIARLGIEKLLPSDVWADFTVTRDSTTWNQLAHVGLEAFEPDTDRYLTWQAEFARLRGLTGRSRAYADSVRQRHEAALTSHPTDGQLHSALAQVYFLLGRPTDAVREAERAVEVVPLERSYVNGMDVLQDLALAYTQAHRKDDAVRVLERLLQMPSTISVPRLRVDPIWDPLRGHPRFQRLLHFGERPST